MENLKIHTVSSPDPLPDLMQLEGALCSMDAIDFKKNLLNYIQSHPQGFNDRSECCRKVDLGGLNALTIAYRKMQTHWQKTTIIKPTKRSAQRIDGAY